EWDNQTFLMELLLLGLGNAPELQTPLFLICLSIYIVTMVGNNLIIVLVVTDLHLHNPCYFFLVNLSSLETCCSSTVLPKLLASFLTGNRTISVQGCMTQFFFFGTFATSECYLLTAMSYDRYPAICQHLLYEIFMNWKVCFQLAAGSWVVGLLISTGITSLLSRQRFCGPGVTGHFFCEKAPLLAISCSDTGMIRVLITILSFPDVVFPFLFTLASYFCIIGAILRIPSIMGRHKTFSTCSSHLVIVAVFYETLKIVYLLPRTAPLRHFNKVFFYAVLTSLINPLIYSLWNREVKGAL
ncbi:OR5BL protein, partial [Alectura lathami]|nr:OR5BL protein [Alectura lathami]